MITPEYLNEIIKGTEDKLQEFQTYLIAKIARQIAMTFDTEQKMIPARVNDVKKLLRTGMLIDDIQTAVVAEYPELEKEVRKAFLKSADEIADYTNESARMLIKAIDKDNESTGIKIPKYKRAGLGVNPKHYNMTSYEVKILETMYKKTKNTMKNMCNSLPTRCSSIYIDACDQAFLKVKHGTSIDTAICDAIKDMADRGIHTVYYGNREERIEVAIARAVRTGINQMNAQMILTRAGELGVKTVITSQHVGARDLGTDGFESHVNWQGKIFSLDWSNPLLSDYNVTVNEKGFEWMDKIKKLIHAGTYKYPDFIKSTGYGDIRGLCGINCRHTFSLWFPENENNFKPIDREANLKQYQKEQYQRSLERAIRRTKTEMDAYANIQSDEAKKRSIELRKTLKAQSESYLNYCKNNGLTPRNWSLKIK